MTIKENNEIVNDILNLLHQKATSLLEASSYVETDTNATVFNSTADEDEYNLLMELVEEIQETFLDNSEEIV